MKLAVLLFEGFELLDVFGPLEMLGHLGGELDISLVAESTGPVRSAQGPAACSERSFADSDDYDIVLVPGGIGTRREVDNPACIDWIARSASRARYTASVCTGAALLARAGVLDGRKATTNKLAYAWVCSQGPNTQWQAKARWVQDGNLFTSAGVSAGIDMALALIQHIWGTAKAEEIALWSEYVWNPDPASDSFAARHGLVAH
ncbi:MAG: DJ-1/PfpI family protein [Halioglobus sp.]|nr:DJ-1/PfpI family protein [Halioglobus sp.]